MKTDDRHAWAVEQMNIQPGDRILEIGCGYGITAALAIEKLKSGNLLAVDQSHQMIEKARLKNQLSITKGMASFIQGSIQTIDLEGKHFDKVYSFNVNVFIKDPHDELNRLAKHLKPGGQIFTFYQPPFEKDDSMKQRIQQQMERNGYTVIRAASKKMVPASVICVVSMPHHQHIVL